MAMQRHEFAKGYITSSGKHFIRVEESYDGQDIEIVVGNDNYDCGCEPCDDCGECNAATEFRISLNRAESKELMFCIKQLHFIDKE